jgi:hypothetical protein
MEIEVVTMVQDAIKLSDRLEQMMEGEDMMVILLALTKVAGVMLAESQGISPDLVDEEKAIAWFGMGTAAAYRGHVEVLKEIAGQMH